VQILSGGAIVRGKEGFSHELLLSLVTIAGGTSPLLWAETMQSDIHWALGFILPSILSFCLPPFIVLFCLHTFFLHLQLLSFLLFIYLLFMYVCIYLFIPFHSYSIRIRIVSFFFSPVEQTYLTITDLQTTFFFFHGATALFGPGHPH
jgi:hypothetical protein